MTLEVRRREPTPALSGEAQLPDSVPPLRRVAQDMPFYALANGSQALAGFLSLALFTRWLPPAEYGLYALTLTTVTVAEAVLFSWVNNATLRYLPMHDREGSDRAFLATHFMTICMLVLATSALWLLSTFVVQGNSARMAQTLRAGLLVLTARAFFGFAVGQVRARRETLRYALYTLFSAFGSVAFAVGLRSATDGPGAIGILCAVSLALAIPAGFELMRSGAFGWLRRSRFLPGVAKHSARYGIPLVGATFGAVVLSLADRYMLQYFRGSDDVGSYSAGYDLADKSLKLLFTVLVASSLPVVMQVLSARGLGEANRLINRMIRVYLVWMVPITTIMIVFRHEVVQMVLGPEFSEAEVVFPWVAVGTLCWGATQIVAQVFLVNERTGTLLYCLLAAAVANVVLNLWLIPLAGLRGAAIATTIGYAAYLLALWRRRIPHEELSFTGRHLAPVVASGVAMFGAMTLVPAFGLPPLAQAAAQLGVGMVVYGVALRIGEVGLFNQSATDARTALRTVWRCVSPERRC